MVRGAGGEICCHFVYVQMVTKDTTDAVRDDTQFSSARMNSVIDRSGVEELKNRELRTKIEIL